MRPRSAIVLFIALTLSLLVASVPAQAALNHAQQEKIAKLHASGLDLINRWKYRDAVPVYKQILAIDPSDRTAQRYLKFAQEQVIEPMCKEAEWAYLDGNYKKSIAIWEGILKTYPEDKRVPKLIQMTNAVMTAKNTESLYTLAEGLIREKRYDDAIKELEKLVRKYSNDPRAKELLAVAVQANIEEKIKRHYETAELYVKQEKFDLAIEEWRRVLDLDDKQEAALRLIADVGKKKLAADYEQAIQLYETGKYSASRDLYHQILTNNPTDADAEKIIAKLDKVLVITDKIEDQGTAWEMTRKAVSNYVSSTGNVTAAIVAARYAEQLEPESGRIRNIREFIEKDNFAIVRSMDPPSKTVSVIDQYLNAALNHIYEGRFDLAVQECEIVLILQPKNVLALKRLGSAYFAIGKRSKAKEIWTKALQLDPKDGELIQFLSKSAAAT